MTFVWQFGVLGFFSYFVGWALWDVTKIILIEPWKYKRQLKQAQRIEPKIHWREMDYNYLEALNELNVMCPTETEEEKGLAKYLEFNDREDHDRRQEKEREREGYAKISVAVRTGGTVSGSFNTLFSPGLANALGGTIGGLGGSIGQLGGALGQLGAEYANQQQAQLGQLEQLAQQRGMMNEYAQGQPGTAQNNINPFYKAKTNAEIAAVIEAMKRGAH